MTSLNKKTIEDVCVEGKRVLVRCDFNVPLKEGKITNDKRIVAALPTIKYLLDNNAKVILCSHLGRPKGEFLPEFSLAPVAARLSELLGKEVKMAKDVVGEDAKALAAALENGDVMLLENVRYHKEETKNVPEFSKELASLAEIYVNDAFGTAHRAHSSTAGVADYLPAVCGYLIQKEISIMGDALNAPKRPLVAILGGAKVSDKIGVMYLGKIVEEGSAREVFENSLHPYTLALISAIPTIEEKKKERIFLSGNMPSAVFPPSGCPFHTRCFMAKEVCKRVPAPLEEVKKGHFCACHFARKATEEKLGLLKRGARE